MAKKVGLVSLGCPKNLLDSEVMLGHMKEAGYELTKDPEEAEILVVNTCGFIGPAKQESIDTILEMAHRHTSQTYEWLPYNRGIDDVPDSDDDRRAWLRPLLDRALATFKETRAGGRTDALADWEDDELPILAMTFHHVILGNFALAPMLREVLDEDPLSPDALERQRRFARKVVRLLILGKAS